LTTPPLTHTFKFLFLYTEFTKIHARFAFAGNAAVHVTREAFKAHTGVQIAIGARAVFAFHAARFLAELLFTMVHSNNSQTLSVHPTLEKSM